MKYLVLRPHEGDKFYNVGDVREAVEGDVKHLVPNTLEAIGGEKSEAAPKNKAVKSAPKNKSE